MPLACLPAMWHIVGSVFISSRHGITPEVVSRDWDRTVRGLTATSDMQERRASECAITSKEAEEEGEAREEAHFAAWV
jgi:hypothetical protein